MLALLLRCVVLLALLAVLARLYASKRRGGMLAEVLDSVQRGAVRLFALAAEDSLARIAVVAALSMVLGVLLGGSAAQAMGAMLVVYVLLAVVGAAVAVDLFSGEAPPANVGEAEGRDYEEVVRIRNRTRKSESKHFDVCDHIVGRWSLRREVATECNSIIELVLRDFIHPWYDWMSDDTDFIRDVQEAIADALGMLLSQLRERVHPIMFVFDTICDAVTRQFQVYRVVLLEVKQDPEMRNIMRSSYNGTVSLEDWNRVQTRIAEEFRRRGRLHPMLIWDGSEAEGADQGSNAGNKPGDRPRMAEHLSMEEFQDPERIKACERSYLRFVSSRIVQKLLVNKENLNSKPIRHLVREIFANTILLPVASLFVPSTINWWIDMALQQMTAANVISDEQEAGLDELPERTGRHFDTIVPVGKPPKGFDPGDPAWAFSAGSVGPEEAACLLAGEPAGSYLIRKSQEDDAPSAYVLSVVVSVAGDDASPVARGADSMASFPLEDASPSMIYPLSANGEVEVKHFRISCTPSSFSVVDKEAIFACIKQPGLIYPAVTNPSTSLSSLCTGLKPVLLKGLDVVQLAIDGGGVVNPELIPTTPVARAVPEDETIATTGSAVAGSTDSEPISAMTEGDEHGEAQALQHLSTGDSANGSAAPQSSEVFGANVAAASSPEADHALDAKFLEEQQRNVLLLELSAAVDELNDFVNYARHHMGVAVSPDDEFAVFPPIPIGDSGGVESVARVLHAVDHILRHGMIITRSAAQSADTTGPRVNSRGYSADGQVTQAARKHSESEGSVQLHFDPSKAGVISDYFQDAGGDALAPDDAHQTARHSASSLDDEHQFEADRAITAVTLANLIHTCRSQLGDLETVDADAAQAAWAWLVHNRRVVFDYGEGARLLDIDASKTKSLSDMSRVTGGRINMLLWLSLGRLAEGIRLLARSDTVLEGVYDDCALMRVRGDRRKMLDALEIVGGQLFTLYCSGATGLSARDKRNFLGRAVSRVFSTTRKPDGSDGSPVSEPKKLVRRPSWRATLSSRPDSKTLDSVDENADVGAEDSRNALASVLSKPMNALKNNFKLRDDADRPLTLERQSSQTMKQVLDAIVSMPSAVLDGTHLPRHLNFNENTKFIDRHRRRFAAAAARWTEKRGDGWRKEKSSPRPEAQNLLTSQLEGFVRSVTGEVLVLDTREPAPAPDPFEAGTVDKPHSIKSRESFARAAWILSSTLRDRDDISSLKRRGIWADPSIRPPLDARISYAHTEPLPQKVPGTKSTITLYCASVSTKSQPAQEWAVARRYNDFDALHRHLRSQVGPNVPLPVLPPKHRLGFGAADSAFIENRRTCLETYLKELLQHQAFANCFELWVFLRPDLTSAVAAMLDASHPANAAQASRAPDLLSDAYMQTLAPKHETQADTDEPDDALSFMVRNLDDVSDNDIYATERRPTLDDMLEKPDELKAVDQPADFEDIPDNKMQLVDAEMMRRIETRVYCLLREVLEMDKMNIVRRQVLALLRRALRMFFTSSVAEWISSKYQLYRKDAHITMLIQFIRETVWPNGVLIQPGVSSSAAEDHSARQKLQHSLKKVVPATLDSLIGRDQSERGMTRVYQMLQNWILLKSLFYIILDLVLIQLLPDLTEVLDGADSLR